MILVVNIIVSDQIQAALMMHTETDSSSIHQLLQLFKQLKTPSGSDPRNPNFAPNLSALSFSSRNFDSANRNPLDSLSIEQINNMHSINSRIKSNKSNAYTSASSKCESNVFQKLYQEKRDMDIRRCRLEYQTRRSKEEKERSECTFSPNIRSRFRIKTQYDSIENHAANDSFYNKNMEWLERKEKSIKKLQCEKNQENVNQFTFTPRINKPRKKDMNKTTVEDEQKVRRNPGVTDYLQRQEKAKKNQEYIKNRQKNPYSHIWNVKQGHFSYAK